MQLTRDNYFQNDVVLIDGQGRSGKNLIALIVSTMKRHEKMNLTSQLDYIGRFYNLEKLSHDAAVVSIRVLIDEKYFYSAIGRDTNFRVSDYSSVWKQGKITPLILRPLLKNEDKLLRKFVNNNVAYQDMTHDGLQAAALYFDALGNRLRIIHVLRDPVENIYEQNKKNFGVRIGTDPREFQLTYTSATGTLPIMAIGKENLYSSGNQIERLVIMVANMLKRNVEGFNALEEKFKKNVYFLDFQKFIQNPNPDLDKLENFINDKYTKSLNRILRRESVPRKIDPKSRIKKIDEIKLKCRPVYIEIFDNLLVEYEKISKELITVK